MRSRLPQRLATRVPPLVTEIAIGIAAAVLSVLVRQALLPITGREAPFALVFVAVLLACLLAGWRSGLIALVAGQVLTWYYILPSPHSFALEEGAAAGLLMASIAELALVIMTALYQREIDRDSRLMTEQLLIREGLVNELNHRVKNTLSIVQSIGHQSLRGDIDPDRAAKDFEGRLMALAAAHQILTRDSWQPVNITDLIATTLAPHGSLGTQFMLDGPNVSLSPKTSVTLAMTIHELATNALKYGALTATDGCVEISWAMGDGRFTFQWREFRGPNCSPPNRKGFGTRMLERALASEIGGKAVLDFDSSGLTYSVEAPARQPL